MYRSFLISLGFLSLFIFLSDPAGSQTPDEHLVQVGDEMYNFGDIKDARDVYVQAASLNPSNITANFKAGKCYLETIHKDQALPYLIKAYELDRKVSPNILYMIGRAYHLGYKFNEAIDYYRKYIEFVNSGSNAKTKKYESQKTSRRIEECETAIQLVNEQPLTVEIENLGDSVNTEFPDYGPVITSDNKTLYFTSRRIGSTGDTKDKDNEFFEDIYATRRNGIGWTRPVNPGKPVNSALHESCLGISPDGKTLYLYIDNDQFIGDIFSTSEMSDGTWSTPKPLNRNINSPYNIESSMCLSPEGKTLYFSSDKPGGIGGKDIYYSKAKKNGEWELPVNLGYDINTEFDEEGPFLALDGKTLYFSSKGHRGMGGYDLFKSVYDSISDKWSPPENLGFPINSTDDDVYFTLSGNGKFGYYASVKQGNKGDLDLYKIHMPEENIQKIETVSKPINEVGPVELNPSPKEPANPVGKVEILVSSFDNETKKPIDVTVSITQKETGSKLWNGLTHEGQVQIDGTKFGSGVFLAILEKSDYLFKELEIRLPDKSQEKTIIKKKVFLQPLKPGAKTVLRNIYFDFDQSVIKPSSKAELNKLLETLRSNPNIKVEIGGHTDSKGSYEYNKALSEARAKAVARWLSDHGVNISRVVAKGYGEETPIASNDDEEEGRELNRRIEFLILK